MCQPQGQNLANVVFALLHGESGTPCHFISVLLPSAENSSGLGSKPTSLSAPTHDSPPRTIEECNYLLTYLLQLVDCCKNVENIENIRYRLRQKHDFRKLDIMIFPTAIDEFLLAHVTCAGTVKVNFLSELTGTVSDHDLSALEES